jgi:hypothetical protein
MSSAFRIDRPPTFIDAEPQEWFIKLRTFWFHLFSYVSYL